jgi:hypothetical protein
MISGNGVVLKLQFIEISKTNVEFAVSFGDRRHPCGGSQWALAALFVYMVVKSRCVARFFHSEPIATA